MISVEPNDLTWEIDGFKYMLGLRPDPDVREVIIAASFDDASQTWKSFLFNEASEKAVEYGGGMEAWWNMKIDIVNAELDRRHGAPDDGSDKTWLEQMQDFLANSVSISNERLKVD